MASAGTELTITRWELDPHLVVMAPLQASFALHARAASWWLLGGTWSAAVTSRAIDRFEEQWLDATVGSLHYTYELDGKEHTRVYHAVSGAEIPFPVEGLSPREAFATYVGTRHGEVWAHAEPDEPTSIEVSPLTDDMPLDIYTSSAEYKAMRSIERDVEAGVVPSGGRAVYFTSRTPCTVCEGALRYFARRYTQALAVHHMADPGTPMSLRFIRERRAFFATLRASIPSFSKAYSVDGAFAPITALRCPIAVPADTAP
jgi:hypothetical protein